MSSDRLTAPRDNEFNDEAALLTALRSGRDDAFEYFVRHYTGRLLTVARRFLNNPEDANDAVQEAFIAAFRSIKTFEGGSSLGTWMHRIVVNAALMKLRSRRRSNERAITEFLPRFLEDGHQENPATPWDDSLIADIESKETQQLVRSAIDQLPEMHRSVLLLRDIEELSTEEAARALDISGNAVKTRLHRARQALRGLLDGQFRGDAA